MADIGYVVFSDSTTTYYETFNAGVAAAVTMYEILRPRG